MNVKKYVSASIAISALALLTACQDDDAKVVNANMVKSAENFEITRRVIFMNGITGDYMLEIAGKCNIEDQVNQLEVLCKTGKQDYKKHFLGLSDNVTYFVEQMESIEASAYHYRTTFKPQAILPDVDFRWDTQELTTNSSEANQ